MIRHDRSASLTIEPILVHPPKLEYCTTVKFCEFAANAIYAHIPPEISTINKPVWRTSTGDPDRPIRLGLYGKQYPWLTEAKWLLEIQKYWW